MQEGIISLMQMTKTAAAVQKHNEAGLLYISILTNPTMGGVTASFAMLADIILAEKGAQIGFTGRRVIEQNIGEKLPADFQTADFQLQHGFVDMIVERQELRDILFVLLEMHRMKKKKLPKYDNKVVCKSKGKNKQAYETVRIARSYKRPTSEDYISKLFEDFVELKGDRVLEDDHAIIAGIAKIHGQKVTVIGQEKGKKNIDESIYRNWGMASPSGYRKVLRLMKQAEKFKRPIICFVDTIGAACGRKAEEEGQGYIIAKLLKEVSTIKVPILSIIIGEGYSGGALALCSGNEVWMLENSVYSILSPEGYASILWKDNARSPEAIKEMKLVAEDLYELKIIDRVIEEKEPINRENMDLVCEILDTEIIQFIKKYGKKRSKDIVDERYHRFRKY